MCGNTLHPRDNITRKSQSVVQPIDGDKISINVEDYEYKKKKLLEELEEKHKNNPIIRYLRNVQSEYKDYPAQYNQINRHIRNILEDGLLEPLSKFQQPIDKVGEQDLEQVILNILKDEISVDDAAKRISVAVKTILKGEQDKERKSKFNGNPGNPPNPNF